MDYDALERLVRLRDQGALSSDEFAEQKRILLANDMNLSPSLATPLRRCRKLAPVGS